MCSLRLIWSARFDAIVALTSPPLISLLGAILARIQHARFIFWVMDLNPDEAIAAGWLNERSVAAAFLRNCLHYSLRQAAGIVVLDRFMRQRILDKGIANETVTILPPWAQDDQVMFDPQGREAFRLKYELTDKFVVMYSGNHSPCHPLATLLEAARQLADHPNLIFCFVGGGTEHKRVKAFAKAHQLQNIRCLPYQPLSSLSASLSAADLHVVVMGDSFTGIVHPCKIYNLLAINGPVLYIGPAPSHVTDIFLAAKELRFHTAGHNDVSKVVQSVLAAERNKPPKRSFPAGVAKRFSKSVLLPELVRIIEEAGPVGVESAANNDPQAASHYALQISDT